MNRLTRLHQEKTNVDSCYEPTASNYYDIVTKLGQIEDILENYGINELWELEMILDYYEHRYDSVETRRKEYE